MHGSLELPVAHTAAVPRRLAARGTASLRRWPIWAYGCLAVLLASPALFAGWRLDDFYQRGILLQAPSLRELGHGTDDLFSFFSGQPDRTRVLVEHGLAVWYVDPEARARFWRPLAAATHWLDHQLWPYSAPLMHAHSLAWFGLAVAAIAALYRRLLVPAWAAILAAILYAVDDAHGLPVMYIANRNALIALLFGVLTLLAHDAWRSRGWRWGAALGPVCLAAALAGGEVGVAFVAYLFAYELFLPTGPWRRRIGAMLPYLLVVIFWRVAWTAGGHGVQNLGFYIDPAAEPLRFLYAVAGRLPLLLLGQWGLPPSNVTYFLPGRARFVALFAAVAFLTLMAVLLWPSLRRSRHARFWAAGMLGSTLPMCATYPEDRMLLVPGIGAMALLGLLLQRVFSHATPRAHWAARLAGGALVAVHLLLAPLLLPLRAANLQPREVAALRTTSIPDDPDIANQTLVLINATTIETPLERELENRPAPQRCVLLAPGTGPLRLTRTAPDTLELERPASFMPAGISRLYRARPFAPGERITLTPLNIEVLRVTEDGRPAAARFAFDAHLEDPGYRWRYWDGTRYARFPLPSVGESVELPG